MMTTHALRKDAAESLVAAGFLRRDMRREVDDSGREKRTGRVRTAYWLTSAGLAIVTGQWTK